MIKFPLCRVVYIACSILLLLYFTVFSLEVLPQLIPLISYLLPHISYLIRHTSYIICHTSYLIPHPPQLTIFYSPFLPLLQLTRTITTTLTLNLTPPQQYILELAKSIKRDPRECVNAFFARLATADGEYKAAFDDEVNSLIQRVKKRAVDRRVEAEEKIKRERLGPGGLDPLEVLESLPESIKDAFSKQDTPALQKAFADLPPEEAKYHYDRVVQSGLWVPAGGAAGGALDGGCWV